MAPNGAKIPLNNQSQSIQRLSRRMAEKDSLYQWDERKGLKHWSEAHRQDSTRRQQIKDTPPEEKKKKGEKKRSICRRSDKKEMFVLYSE